MCHSVILYKEALKHSRGGGGKSVLIFFVINVECKGQSQNVDILRCKWCTKLRFPLDMALKWYKSGLCILIQLGLHV